MTMRIQVAAVALITLAPFVIAPQAGAQDDSAARTLQAIEERLATSPPTIINFTVGAQGAFSADLSGDLRLGEAQGGLRAQGFFGDDSYLLHLEFGDGRVRGGNGADEFAEDAGDVTGALVVGLTRMGVLHNLARLTSGASPDHADGGVAEWVTAENVEWAEGDPDGSGPIALGLNFDLMVDGVPSAEVTLWLDDRGLPRMRMQTVRFPQGRMDVTEQYRIDLPESG